MRGRRGTHVARAPSQFPPSTYLIDFISTRWESSPFGGPMEETPSPTEIPNMGVPQSSRVLLSGLYPYWVSQPTNPSITRSSRTGSKVASVQVTLGPVVGAKLEIHDLPVR